PPHWRIGQAALLGSSPHVAPRLRLQARQRWRRHARPAALPGPPQHHAHGAIYRAAFRPLRWVLEGLREHKSDETDPTGERRRRWRLGSVAARPLWPSPSAPNSNRKSAVKSAIWPAVDTFPAVPLAMLTYWLTLGHPKAATGHPERADRRRCWPRRTSSNSSHDVGGGIQEFVAFGAPGKSGSSTEHPWMMELDGIYVPPRAPWPPDLKAELLAFPTG